MISIHRFKGRERSSVPSSLGVIVNELNATTIYPVYDGGESQVFSQKKHPAVFLLRVLKTVVIGESIMS